MSLAQAYLAISLKIPVEDVKVKQRLDRAYEIVRCNGEGYKIVPQHVVRDVCEICGELMEWHQRSCSAHPGAKKVTTTRLTGYKVEKASTSLLEDTGTTYGVTLETCSCPDFEKARGGLCKHRLAIMLLAHMEKTKV